METWILNTVQHHIGVVNGLCHRALPTDSPQLNSMFPGGTVHQRVPCPRHAPFPGAVNIKWLAEVGTQRPSLLISIEDISGGFRDPYDMSQGLCCKHIRVHLTQPCPASLTSLRALPEKWPAATDLHFNMFPRKAIFESSNCEHFSFSIYHTKW